MPERCKSCVTVRVKMIEKKMKTRQSGRIWWPASSTNRFRMDTIVERGRATCLTLVKNGSIKARVGVFVLSFRSVHVALVER